MIDFHDILRILVIKLRHIGDVLLTAPVFRALRETFPGARICALVHSGTQDVLEGNPDIDEVLVFDRGVKNLPFPRQVVREGKFAHGIRERGFDLAIDLTGGDRAAILSYLSGARYRIGWRDRKGFAGKRWMYTNLHSPDQNCHMVAQNLSVVRSVGITTRNAAVTFPVSAKDRERAKEILREYSGKWHEAGGSRCSSGMLPASWTCAGGLPSGSSERYRRSPTCFWAWIRLPCTSPPRWGLPSWPCSVPPAFTIGVPGTMSRPGRRGKASGCRTPGEGGTRFSASTRRFKETGIASPAGKAGVNPRSGAAVSMIFCRRKFSLSSQGN